MNIQYNNQKLSEKYFWRSLKSHTSILLILFLTYTNVQAQSNKIELKLNDVREWRTHSTTLSDDGEWYTILYSLFDESDEQRDTIAQQIAESFFNDHNKTDVLYISSKQEDIKYKIPYGRKPQFSMKSDWIAYQIKPKSKNQEENDEKEIFYIELKHLESGFTVKYESNANFQFLEDKNYFITIDENSLLLYDLENRREHYIGSIGEYIIDKKSAYIVYTISTEDQRGNGIYLFNPTDLTTKPLVTGRYMFSNLAWNKERNSLAGYKYRKNKNNSDSTEMKILVVDDIRNNKISIKEFDSDNIKGLGNSQVLATKSKKSGNDISWSNDSNRLFVKLKDKPKKDKESKVKEEVKKAASLQVWHWLDKKLLSERIVEYDKKKEKPFAAVFNLETKTITQLTNNENQSLHLSDGTNKWGILVDKTNYISDWDVSKGDLYRINLHTGEQNLIVENHSSSWYSKNFYISPDGMNMVFWDGKDYWHYSFSSDYKQNLTANLSTSFVNKDYDKYGYSPDYGLVGWIKNQDAVLVEDEFNLWSLPYDVNLKAKILTNSDTQNDNLRFRIEDYSFEEETEIENQYIDLTNPIILNAYNTKTKFAGYYKLFNEEVKLLDFQASSYAKPWRGQNIIRAKNSDAIIYNKGDYNSFPESYLSDLNFNSPKRITYTNPQQENFKWGKRILIDYTNEDGIPLQGVLSIPETYKKGQKLPMIVYSYEKMSYSMYRYAMPYLNGAVMPEMLLVSNGYLFFRPDIHFNVGTPHSDMHECIDAAIEKVLELGYVDKDKIGYQGFSFGGHCGMYISTQKNKFAAIAAGAGVSNLVQGFNLDIVRDGSNEQDYYMTGQGRLGTDPTSDIDMYIRESPVFNAQTMDTPLLLFHGTADNVVQWEHSFGFYSILRYLKKPVVLLSYLGEGHGMDKVENRIDLQKRLLDYFNHYLKGAEAKDWMIKESTYSPTVDTKDKDKRTLPKWK